MTTIKDLKGKLIQEDKLMSIERINEIREKTSSRILSPLLVNKET